MSVEQPSYEPSIIINHVPTQAELTAAARVEAEHQPEHAIPREQVNAILRGMGISPPDTYPVQPETSPRQTTRPLPHLEAPEHEPYEPQEHELPVSAQELKRLREQIALEDSKATN